MLRITKNDLILFKYLMEEKFIHIDIVKKYLGKDYEESSYRRRLSELRKEGYIKYVGDPLSYRHYIFPTEKALIVYKLKYEELKKEIILNGNSLVGYHDPEKYNLKKNINFSTIVEDIQLTELRFLLENLGIDRWSRSNMYYNKYAKNPDAIFKIGIENKMDTKYAVELETEFKGDQKYENEFMKYDKVEKIDFKKIIYITTKNSIYNKLADIIQNKVILGLSSNKWKKKYSLIKYNDLLNGQFIIYSPIKNKKNNNTEKLKKNIKIKKKVFG